MDLKQRSTDFDAAIEYLKTDLNSIRTNRAAPALLENIMVEVYGSKMPLKQLASIQAPEPKMLTVEPWDRNIIKDVERAIQTASLGFAINNQGTFLRLIISPMTEESRQKLIKVLHDKLENARMAMRGIRDKIKEEITGLERNKEISEDEKYKLVEDLDEMTRQYNETVREVGEKKEEEIKL
ncbi:ribosome recycling factor [Candidatus Kuenenbacteria bacterium CG_4_9_14_3_um_filter_39_14]|uniref:Ribosome recycling factor n=6 Tax=Candidatus Kueneniibacteriota TaxID=1752740 RepID=A0A2M7ILL3_9BACT|nr:MAG: ribosome recycling factor [Candidatus Kuenenbacteria bacterium CG2_30_39_24]PIP28887.1 MAG: ribosome recycling factor [Candidatus Kuenenbacteria bacterium CG23_combo_of_CG06-09_8_20_14_all_39_39]PIR81168.1 MAG: ribosome recycling factor [Candidatus Kuenenbacteria bacterium CG10_big_fil_rev_8_21_14_0_10_39_14]PIW95658.1 MAG: ribosome recycling factor [Candidatus Kuenenbacteria bacterium CG_4_8_14_3_um_filter_39_15]PIX91974.1 MAG: ribosome recycling factor [Candidatus Kuenenbacteria bacte